MSNDAGQNRTRRGVREPTVQERQLWEQVTRDVRPIPRDRQCAPVDAPSARPQTDAGSVRDAAREAPAAQNAKPRPKPPAYTAKTATAAPKTAVRIDEMAGVDRRTADRLKRGRLGIDARIDLHGMTRQAARDALFGFIDRAMARGHRCVLVITGKGRSREDGGVLRQDLPHWLNLPPVRGRIVAVAQAQQRDGGAGAFYVLLRRRRGDEG